MALKNIKLYAKDGAQIDSEELSADFRGAEKVGPMWVGERGFYYRSGLKKYYVPISSIDHAYERVREVDTHCCCGGYSMYVYCLVVASGGSDIVEINCDENGNFVTRVRELLSQRSGGAIRTDYTQADKDAKLARARA